MPVKPKKKVNEGNSFELEFQLVDFDGITGIPDSSITSCNLTIKDQLTSSTITGYDNISLTPSTYFDASGNFSMVLGPTASAVQNADRWLDDDDEEIHVATFDIIATSGSNPVTFKEEIWIAVQNLRQSS